MSLFKIEDYKITISAKYARQRFLCSAEYSAGVCHGACCAGPSIVLLMAREAETLKAQFPDLPIFGQVLSIRGKQCPLALPNGHCKIFDSTKLRPFICTITPFCMSKHRKLIIDNGFMRRRCRVRQNVEGGQPAYRAFGMALRAIFGVSGAALITRHFDNGGGDITVPVTREVMEALMWHRGVVEKIKKFGYKETVIQLANGVDCL